MISAVVISLAAVVLLALLVLWAQNPSRFRQRLWLIVVLIIPRRPKERNVSGVESQATDAETYEQLAAILNGDHSQRDDIANKVAIRWLNKYLAALPDRVELLFTEDDSLRPPWAQRRDTLSITISRLPGSATYVFVVEESGQAKLRQQGGTDTAVHRIVYNTSTQEFYGGKEAFADMRPDSTDRNFYSREMPEAMLGQLQPQYLEHVLQAAVRVEK